MKRFAYLVLYSALSAWLIACASKPLPESNTSTQFTLAVIPDTQYMLDYRHQKSAGFPIDASEMFIEQMQFLADQSVARGGEIVFATAVGDIWQHTDNKIDAEHLAKGMSALSSSKNVDTTALVERIKNFEMPLAKRGFDLLHEAGLPFAVAPGNHDYDSVWRDSRFPTDFSRINELKDERGKITYFDPEIMGMLHAGGLNNFNQVFGASSDYYRDSERYISHFNGGANSAQLFTAGAYQFLHLTLEMQAGEAVLEWAQSVLDKHPDLPTIVNTHDYLDVKGRRRPLAFIDYARVDPSAHKHPEDLWQDFIRVNSQVFLVLSGHHAGQAYRVDRNQAAQKVHQVLADYQDRGRVALDADGKVLNGIGDGWLRLMAFDLGKQGPNIRVRTYSTYYKQFSSEHEHYVSWYRRLEQPAQTEAEFLAGDDFVIDLQGFHERFAKARQLER